MIEGELDHDLVDRIYAVCPGVRVEGLPQAHVGESTNIDPIWGPYLTMQRAYAADPHIRYAGSTGGVLTALSTYLLRSQRVAMIYHVTAPASRPTFGEALVSRDAESVLQGAGSRYGPTAQLKTLRQVLDTGEPFAFVGKPCDVAAVRNYARLDSRVDELCKFHLTPVCGGFMDPPGMHTFLHAIGIDPADVKAFRYRGYGCPGATRIETHGGKVVEKDYLDLWGEDESAWQLPFRCKICPDGIGEAADIAASDTWPGGSPTREGQATDPGINGVIARTAAGLELLRSAISDGALVRQAAIGPDDMSTYQPHQVAKKYAAWARFTGLRAAGQLVPSTARLRLQELARQRRFTDNLSEARGTRVRARQGKATEPTPRMG